MRILALTAEGDSAGIEKAALNTLSASGALLKVSLQEGEILLPSEALNAIAAKAGGDITFSLKKTGTASSPSGPSIFPDSPSVTTR